jgi:hypothetical protein
MAQKAAMASRFLERKIEEYEALKAEIATLSLFQRGVSLKGGA